MEFWGKENTVVIHDASKHEWLRFSCPEDIHEAGSTDEVLKVLGETEAAVRAGNLYAAGFVSYDAAPAFDRAFLVRGKGGPPDLNHDDQRRPAFQTGEGSDFPLAWFGLFREPEVVTLGPHSPSGALPLSWESSVTREEYTRAILRIKEHLREGDTYQVNYTFRLRSHFAADPWELFTSMLGAQKGAYGAFINTRDWAVCSASPELFFRLDGRELTSRPMKGTAPRAPGCEEDLEQAAALGRCGKNRAENLMIVDMVRNDMGRISETGSVRVPALYEVEKYPSMWQMTSTVRSKTDAGLAGIFQALFPPASITGAPRARTMEIISRLETSARRIYTGSIGFLSPKKTAQFNVAIRTVLIDKNTKTAEYGVGGGIVWDSADSSEFEECWTKASILTRGAHAFDLLETMLWEPSGGYFLLDRHLKRLAESASYFDRRIQVGEIRERLARTARGLERRPHLVRLMVPQDGGPVIETHEAPSRPRMPYRVCVARDRVDSTSPFLYHKTTHRATYEQALAASPGYDDVLLLNERDEVTESCRANIVIEKDGRILTPPIRSGVLPGTFRALLLEQGTIEEEILHLEDLQLCSRVFLINSVRGMWEVELCLQG